jgi:alpha-aminoadipic semialdehyde synthase
MKMILRNTSSLLQNNAHKFRLYTTSSSQIHMSARACQKVIAIRREDQSIWERRAPLSPNQVRKLVMKDGYKVIVQPSNRRAFQIPEYVAAGAVSQEDLSEASVILGVKQVPCDSLLPNKTYVFFSHTIKAQEANMPLLDAALEKNVMLIDYEKIVDSKNQRLVAFGTVFNLTLS